MFNHTHYVPVLRWKQAEWLALRDLHSTVKSRITPLIEFIPGKLNTSNPEALEKNISKTCKDFAACWGPSPAFIDFLHCPTQAVGVLSRIQTLTQNVQLRLIPVVNLRQNQAWRNAVAVFIAANNTQACIRLNLGDITGSTFNNQIQGVLSDLSLAVSSVHLIVDYGFITPQRQLPHLIDVLSRLPHLNDWCTLSIIGGAFLKDLSTFTPGINTLQRLDWTYWREQTSGNGLPRIPTYGDYAIQHANYEEPPLNANFSASIRYAAQDSWTIMRGEGVRNEGGPGYAQYPANAALLRERPEFSGRNFSRGDMYIDDMGVQTEKTGNARTWLQAGINHHLTLVVRSLANSDEI